MKTRAEGNCLIAELETPGAYSAFKMGVAGDTRNWNRHPETVELTQLMQSNGKQAYVVVQYKDTYTRVK